MLRTLTWTILLIGFACAPGCLNLEGDAAGECEDGADNDRDGFYDCDDPDCSGSPSCDGDDDTVSDDDTQGDDGDDTQGDDDDTTAAVDADGDG